MKTEKQKIEKVLLDSGRGIYAYRIQAHSYYCVFPERSHTSKGCASEIRHRTFAYQKGNGREWEYVEEYNKWTNSFQYFRQRYVMGSKRNIREEISKDDFMEKMKSDYAYVRHELTDEDVLKFRILSDLIFAR